MGTPGLLDFDPVARSTFNAAYWASYPPIITSTFDPNSKVDFETLKTKAIAFTQQGYKIDVFVMLMKQDPYITMRERADWLGFASVPALGEAPVTLTPGLGGPSNAGSIKVSYDVADYPPFPVPVAPVVAGRSPVGSLLTGKTHLANMPESSTYHNGDRATFAGVTFTFSFPGIFSPPLWIAD